jgi:DNA-binding LacI/PurR family transcriptional regulator/anti-anti-sigma regulatory factor
VSQQQIVAYVQRSMRKSIEMHRWPTTAAQRILMPNCQRNPLHISEAVYIQSVAQTICYTATTVLLLDHQLEKPLTSPHGILAALLPWNGELPHAEIVDGFHHIASAAGYRSVCLNGSFRDWQEQLSGTDVTGWVSDWQGQIGRTQIAGWMIINSPGENRWLADLSKQRIPIVGVSPLRPTVGYPVVVPDNRSGAQRAVEHLLAHGHRRIAFIGAVAHPDIAARADGYRAALASYGITPDPALLINIDWRADFWSKAAGQDALVRLLAAEVPCNAIYAATDALALGVLAALQQANLRVPQDYALASFDNTSESHTSNPPLTTVHQSFRLLGEAAATLLLAQIQGEHVERGPHSVPTTLITRSSCGCPPAFLHPLRPHQADVSERRALIQAIATITAGPTGNVAGTTAPATALVEQFAIALADDDRDQWAAHLTETMNAFGQQIESITDLHAALAVLEANASTFAAPDLPPATTRLRSTELIRIAERAAADSLLRASLAGREPWVRVASASQSIGDQLLRLDRAQALALTWLEESSVERGYLFLNREDLLGHDGLPTLELAGTYTRTGSALAIGLHCDVTDFPPARLRAEIADIPLQIYPVNTATHSYGLLCLVPTIGDALVERSYTGSWAGQLAILLEREELIHDLQRSRDSLAQAYDHEHAMTAVIRDLSAPVIPLTAGILALPLIGTIDEQRAERIMEGLLTAISTYQAQVVVFDITGVPIVDTQVASYIIRATQAARLLGTQVILTGIRPEIAQTIVGLGIDTSQILTLASLEAGLRYALRLRGLQITRQNQEPRT